MTPESAAHLVGQMFSAAFFIAAPLLAIGLVAGIIVSLIQVVTSIQDSSFNAIPRLAAFLGGCVFTGLAFLSQKPSLCLGASGAVTAVMVLFACHYPTRMILVFFVLPVPIWLFVLFQVAVALSVEPMVELPKTTFAGTLT